MRSERCTKVWEQRYEFRGQIDIMSSENNNSSRPAPGDHELPTWVLGQMCGPSDETDLKSNH